MGEGGSLLVLGGARSGKSRYAQARAEAFTGDLVFVATAQAFDAEMEARIAHHRADRGSRWRTIEETLDLAAVIAVESRPGTLLLIDCLTLWCSNLIFAKRDTAVMSRDLVAALAGAEGPVIIVANEVGWGIVPDNALARQFRDVAGMVNQAVAAAVDEAVLIAAGLALPLKRGKS